MRAMKRAIAGAEDKSAMRQVSPRDLIWGSQLRRKRRPAVAQDLCLFAGDRISKSIPARTPPLSARAHAGIIPMMEALRRNSGAKQNEKEQIAQGHSPCALFDLIPGGGLHWRVEQCDFAGTTQPPGKIDIFHERNWSEARQPRKNTSPNENALIAVNRAESAGVRAFEVLQPAQARMAFIEAAIKAAADAVAIEHGMGERLQVAVGQHRINVVKQENVAGRKLSAEVHLHAAPGPIGGTTFYFPIRRFDRRLVSHAGDNHFMNQRMRGPFLGKGDRRLLIFPARNDHRDGGSGGHGASMRVGVHLRCEVSWAGWDPAPSTRIRGRNSRRDLIDECTATT